MAFDQVEGDTGDGRGGDRRRGVTVVGERGAAAVVAEPDHDFVGLGGGGRAAEESVVGDVGDDGGAGVTVFF